MVVARRAAVSDEGGRSYLPWVMAALVLVVGGAKLDAARPLVARGLALAIPVVPVALRGVRSVMRDGTWYLRRAAVSVTIGTPIRPEGEEWAEAIKLREEVREEIMRK